MAPDLSARLDVLDTLRQCEASFHRPEADRTREDFARMIAESFWEIGASGHRYDREATLQILDARRFDPPPGAWDISDAHCTQLCAGTFLLSYSLLHQQRLSRRSTIWRCTDGQWQMLFHQGTLVSDA